MDVKTAENEMIEALEKACKAAEFLSNWDKSPQKEWYYAAKKQIRLNQENLLFKVHGIE